MNQLRCLESCQGRRHVAQPELGLPLHLRLARTMADDDLLKASSDDIEYGAGLPSEAHLPVA